MATFGYTSQGASTTSISNIVGNFYASGTGAGSFVVNSISAYINPTSSSSKFKFALYLASDNSLVGETVEQTGDDTTQWYTLNFTSPPAISNTNYIICAFADDNTTIAYDSGLGAWLDLVSSYPTFPNPESWTVEDFGSTKLSIYATYESAAAGNTTNFFQFIN